jgi:hypothetical protein
VLGAHNPTTELQPLNLLTWIFDILSHLTLHLKTLNSKDINKNIQLSSARNIKNIFFGKIYIFIIKNIAKPDSCYTFPLANLKDSY